MKKINCLYILLILLVNPMSSIGKVPVFYPDNSKVMLSPGQSQVNINQEIEVIDDDSSEYGQKDAAKIEGKLLVTTVIETGIDVGKKCIIYISNKWKDICGNGEVSKGELSAEDIIARGLAAKEAQDLRLNDEYIKSAIRKVKGRIKEKKQALIDSVEWEKKRKIIATKVVADMKSLEDGGKSCKKNHQTSSSIKKCRKKFEESLDSLLAADNGINQMDINKYWELSLVMSESRGTNLIDRYVVLSTYAYKLNNQLDRCQEESDENEQPIDDIGKCMNDITAEDIITGDSHDYSGFGQTSDHVGSNNIFETQLSILSGSQDVENKSSQNVRDVEAVVDELGFNYQPPLLEGLIEVGVTNYLNTETFIKRSQRDGDWVSNLTYDHKKQFGSLDKYGNKRAADVFVQFEGDVHKVSMSDYTEGKSIHPPNMKISSLGNGTKKLYFCPKSNTCSRKTLDGWREIEKNAHVFFHGPRG